MTEKSSEPARYPVDLQVHSTRSDGTDSPTELVEQAVALGIHVLAITDHDSVLGVDEALSASENRDVQILPAIEFSTTHEPQRDFLDINILGYGIRHRDPHFASILDRVISARIEQKIRQIERLQSYGVQVPVDEVLALAGGVPGRPHIARIALRHNPDRFESINDVFRLYLSSSAPNSTYVGRSFSLKVEESIELIHHAGGFAVLAHPGSYRRIKDLEGALKRMVDAGLDGLEVRYPYPKNRQERVDRFSKLAEYFGLVSTGGSDYHGFTKANRIGEAGLTLSEWETLAEAMNVSQEIEI